MGSEGCSHRRRQSPRRRRAPRRVPSGHAGVSTQPARRPLDGSGLEKIVAQSTYGAQPGEGKGDLNVLYDLEQALAAQPISVSVIRAAYYMSNWDAALKTATT
jgi:uncharacterized protein YbjT (DUF2867 family)